MSVIVFEDEAEAIWIANDSTHVLTTGVWTRDIGRLFPMTKAPEVYILSGFTYRLSDAVWQIEAVEVPHELGIRGG